MTGRPIFLLGVQRGGTNQALNILRSHPDTYWPQGEFHEVFRPRGLRGAPPGATLQKLARYAPIWIGAGDILDPDRAAGGPGLAGRRGRAAAAGLRGAAAANRPAVARYKAALREHGLLDAGAEPSRLLVKVMNYNLRFAEDLAALYPQAVFVGLIRDAAAVCEGHVARGASVAAAAAAWVFVADRLIALEAAGLALRVWRFEDLLADAGGVARAIYGFAGLDPAAARGVCLQDKARITGADGAVRGVQKTEHFYSFDAMSRHMRADANAGARARLPEAARAEIAARCAPQLRHFGYA